jgi:hypothetical protein
MGGTFMLIFLLGRGWKKLAIWQVAPHLHALGTYKNFMHFREKMNLSIAF